MFMLLVSKDLTLTSRCLIRNFVSVPKQACGFGILFEGSGRLVNLVK